MNTFGFHIKSIRFKQTGSRIDMLCSVHETRKKNRETEDYRTTNSVKIKLNNMLIRFNILCLQWSKHFLLPCLIIISYNA